MIATQRTGLTVERVARVGKALGDGGRVRALGALRGGELCLCHLTELLELSPATVSRHMAVLASAGLVQMRKDGRWHYYRLRRAASPLVRRALRWACDAVQQTPQGKRDAAKVRRLSCD